MSERLYELLKYPIIFISAVIAMSLAEFFLEIDFSRISKVGTSGIEFNKEERVQLLNTNSEFEAQLANLQIQIDVLSKELTERNDSSNTDMGVEDSKFQKAVVENFFKTQTVSDQTASFSIERKTNKPLLMNQEGFIFLGNYDKTKKKWTNEVLKNIDQSAVEVSPQELKINDASYEVSGNMVLRASMPNDDEAYYKDAQKLGVVPKFSKIRILEKPVGIDRKFAVQYWAKIRVEE